MDENASSLRGSDERLEPAASGAEPAHADEVAGEAPRRPRSFWRDLPFLLGVALVISLLLKMFVVQSFYIPSPSMENTLLVSDRILVDKVSYRLHDVRRGDVVVFNGADSFAPEVESRPASGGVAKLLRGVAGWFGVAPPGERDFVKRVIGIGGDRVACCDADGRITVNGVSLDERYLHPDDIPSSERFDVRVPRGKLWVMGDHRAVSQDSRAHLGDPGGGFVPADRVIGRAILVIWPLNRFSTLPEPDTFSRPGLAAGAGGDATPAAALGSIVILPAAALRRRARLCASRYRG
jgi:signal peptidase I